MDDFKKQLYKHAGERIRRARLVKGLSQIELSQKLGYADSSTIYKIEKGLQKIPNSKMRELCKILDIDNNYLLNGFDFVIDNDGQSIVIENKSIDDRRNVLMDQATGYLYQASETQLEKIVKILSVIIGSEDNGNADL